jgi:hypothetical protein
MPAEQTNHTKLAVAIAAGIVAGGIVLWFARLALTAGLISALFSGLNFTFNEPPSSAVTRSASYQRAMKAQGTNAATVAQVKRDHERQRTREDQQLELKRRRSESNQGGALWAKCEEWAENYKRLPTETIRLNGKYYCDRYDRFIETGYVAQGNAPVLETR